MSDTEIAQAKIDRLERELEDAKTLLDGYRGQIDRFGNSPVSNFLAGWSPVSQERDDD